MHAFKLKHGFIEITENTIPAFIESKSIPRRISPPESMLHIESLRSIYQHAEPVGNIGCKIVYKIKNRDLYFVMFGSPVHTVVSVYDSILARKWAANTEDKEDWRQQFIYWINQNEPITFATKNIVRKGNYGKSTSSSKNRRHLTIRREDFY